MADNWLSFVIDDRICQIMGKRAPTWASTFRVSKWRYVGMSPPREASLFIEERNSRRPHSYPYKFHYFWLPSHISGVLPFPDRLYSVWAIKWALFTTGLGGCRLRPMVQMPFAVLCIICYCVVVCTAFYRDGAIQCSMLMQITVSTDASQRKECGEAVAEDKSLRW